MKEKELRLALVLFGGVSLAVYQHGINRELLNLARASRAYHRVEGPAAKQAPGHAYPAGAGADAWTAEVYFDLLKRLGRTVDLRVLVDVISGASAGAGAWCRAPAPCTQKALTGGRPRAARVSLKGWV